MHTSSIKKTFLAGFTLSALSLFTILNAQDSNTLQADKITTTAKHPDGELNKIEINSRFIEDTQSQTLTDLSNSDASILVGGGNAISSKIYIRGFEDTTYGVSIDGAFQGGNIFHHQGNISINPLLIKSIEGEKGYASAKNAQASLAGSLSFKLKNAFDLLRKDQKFGFSVNAGFQSNFGASSGVSLYGKAGENTGILASFQQVYFPYYGSGHTRYGIDQKYFDTINNVPGKVVQGSKNNNYSTLFKINTNISENDKIELNYNFYANSSVAPFGANVILGEGTLFNSNTFNHNTSFAYIHENDNFSAKFDTYYSNRYLKLSSLEEHHHHEHEEEEESHEGHDHEHEVESLKLMLQNVGANLVFENRYDLLDVEYGLNYKLIYALGLDIPNEALISHGSRSFGRDYANIFGGFVDTDFHLLSNLDLNLASRYDFYNYVDKFNQIHNTSFLEGFSPRAALTYTPINEITMKLSYALTQKGATPSDSQQLYNAEALVSRNLKAQSMQNFEYDLNFTSKHFHAHANIYYSMLSNFINTYFNDSHGGEHAEAHDHGFLKINQAKRIDTFGYELGVGSTFGGFVGDISLSHALPRYDGNLLADTYELAIYTGFSLNLNLSYSFEDIGLKLGWLSRYVDGTGYYNAGNIYFNIVERYRKGGYDVHNLYISYDPFKDDTLKINFAILNILDRLYANPASPFKEVFAQEGSNFQVYEPGINAKINISYKF